MSGVAVRTEACMGTKDRASVDGCPVDAIYADDRVPDATPAHKYNPDDPHDGHDHTFFIEHSRNVFAD